MKSNRLRDWWRPARLLLTLALLVSLLPATATMSGATARLQPQLAEIAAKAPNSQIGIIVQKTSAQKGVEGMVARLGGKITKDLHIINAFAAEMPARNVAQLAREPGVRWVSLDAPVVKAAAAINVGALSSAYPQTVGASRLWNSSPTMLQGQGIGVAVVDSGVSGNADFTVTGQTTKRILTNVKFNSATNSMFDGYGHGTHVAGIVAGNGSKSSGKYVGIAPDANLINVKVSDDVGGSIASDVVNGLQWVLNNKATYNIKIANLSLNSSVAQSYNVDPICAAVEILWFNGITVVVSAGNNGSSTLFPPANDPFVITVGATDDKGTTSLGDDTMASFSAYGVTSEGFSKPDLVAPGTNIVSVLASTSDTLATQHPSNVVNSGTGSGSYFKMSGTSMAAPMVAGAAALLLQDEPNLTPDQVKYRLKSTANRNTTTFPGYNPTTAGAGLLDVYAAVNGTSTLSANTGTAASQLLWTGSTPITWNSVNWNSVNWNSVNWSSVNWNSVNWGSVNWGSDYWGR